MPVSFKDKNGKKHVFKDHAEFVSWLKKNRPDIENPDGFAARIERNQSDTSKFSTYAIHEHSKIINRNLITGELVFTDEDKVVVKNIEIFLKGIDVPIVILEAVKTDFGAKFDYIIDSRASAGEYTVVWNVTVDGQDTRAVNNFLISDDNIDRTLPLELQHLA